MAVSFRAPDGRLQSFNTVLNQNLLLAPLHGELSAPPDVTAWLDRRRSIGKNSYWPQVNRILRVKRLEQIWKGWLAFPPLHHFTS
jgi:hypothetical protein